jgi:hypothetical protein
MQLAAARKKIEDLSMQVAGIQALQTAQQAAAAEALKARAQLAVLQQQLAAQGGVLSSYCEEQVPVRRRCNAMHIGASTCFDRVLHEARTPTAMFFQSTLCCKCVQAMQAELTALREQLAQAQSEAAEASDLADSRVQVDVGRAGGAG